MTTAGPPSRAPRDPLRGEIYGLDALATHAREMALLHADAAPRGPLRPLLDEFRRTSADLLRAYRTIEAAARADHDPAPAEEWLLDNFHTVEEQLREVVEDLPQGYLVRLPRLPRGHEAGYPRIYPLARDLIAHTDARIDRENLLRYVAGYQDVTPLTIGELWAVAIMLRLGLVENLCALTQQEVVARAEREVADRWADRLLERARQRRGDSVIVLAELARSDQPLTDGFVVRVFKRLRDEDVAMGPVFAWLDERLGEAGSSAEEAIRRERHRQAVNQVSVGNCITSMRIIGALDWADFFSQTSFVERELATDPAGAYAGMDIASLDRYRHEVELLAAGSGVSETEVARRAVAQAAAETGTDAAAARRRHIGYALIDAGRPALEAALGYGIPRAERLRRRLLAHPLAAYLTAIGLLLTLLVAVPDVLAWQAGVHLGMIGLMTVLLLLPASELAISTINFGVTRVLSPRSLPKLALTAGVPAAYRTVVVVPALLTDRAAVRKLVADLEIRYLANAEAELRFALLTDFPDAAQAELAGDAALLALARREIRALDQRHAGGRGDRFFLLHRERRWNGQQGIWMGWERKRGKLEEFNRLLRGGTDTSFTVTVGDLAALADVRYVVTLDADTGLPRDTARALIGTIAHPLNRAVFDAREQRVIAGYGIIQPRVSTTLVSAGRSWFARIFTGNTGLDPYTAVVSDIYQDLFGEGSYYGKGIYDVDAFQAALAGRVPENHLLSHDLFEGLFARTGLASDVELLDDYPSHYLAYASRQHRWVRGDWQLLPWLLPIVPGGGRTRNDLAALDRWKLFDNLRRSLLPPAILAVLVAGWTILPGLPGAWTALALSAIAFPIAQHLTTTLLQAGDPARTSYLRGFWGDLGDTALRVLVTVVFLLDQAVIMLGAIGRTLLRLLVTHRNLLQWETASEAERRVTHGLSMVLRRMWPSVALAVVILVLTATVRPDALPLAVPLILAWLLAPGIAELISRPLPPRTWHLAADDLQLLRRTARKTWRFFETFVTETDHWLPPDNYQEDPRGVIAHRTSPTNIGLYLLATLAARDFGYLSLASLSTRLAQTFDTLGQMEWYRGHLYNWYDTVTLRPLSPLYVSTVDSGNLAGHLIVVREGCAEAVRTPLVGPALLAGLEDSLLLWAEAEAAAEGAGTRPTPGADTAARLRAAVARAVTAPPTDLVGWRGLLDDLLAPLDALAADLAAPTAARPAAADDAVYWAAQVSALLGSTRDELDRLAPWARLFAVAEQGGAAEARAGDVWSATRAALGGALTLADLPDRCAAALAALETSSASDDVMTLRAALEASQLEAGSLAMQLARLGQQAARLVDSMDFALVYDPGRHLFAIGFNPTTAALDNSYYDLLASEARLASLVAIAYDRVPQTHWFRLGRQLAPAAGSRALISWSGTMFEYLMPLLVMRRYPQTLLDETYHAVVARQIEYGARRGVPWGNSESAYNTLDLALNYQYRAFGVPGLGLKPGLADDLVVAPYATLLALPLDAPAGVANLRALTRDGLDGRYGMYESIDYTASRVPPGRRAVVVRAFMAHHEGMSLVALDNLVHGDPMVRRFHAAPRIRATELLLQERLPGQVELFDIGHEETMHQAAGMADEGPTDRIGQLDAPIPSTMLLSNGTYSGVVTAAGAGASTYRGLAITRWREDATLDRGGLCCYVRDHASGRVWSATYQPTQVAPDEYQVVYTPEVARFRRRDGLVETLTEVVISPEDNVEVRRVTLTNLGEAPLQLDLTSYAEIALNPPAADLAHPAFGNLFVETEFVPTPGALLCTRRPRSAEETPAWLAHVTAVEGAAAPLAEYETSRARFLGRTRDAAAPVALDAGVALTNTVGPVLDPALSLRRQVTLACGERVAVSFSLIAADSRQAALDLAERFSDPRAIARTFELAWTDARVELRHLNLTARQAHQFQELAASLLYNDPERRAPAALIVRNTRQQSHLWAYGISGDRPILVVRVDDPEATDLVHTLLLAHEYWRLNTLSVDLVILNEDPGGYLQPLQDALLAMIRSSPAQGHLSQPGGVFVLRADLLPEEDRTLLLAVARVVLQTSRGRLSRQLVRPPRTASPPAASAAPAAPSPAGSGEPAALTPCARQYFNGRGGFSEDGREYVVDLPPGAATPAPWINVVANAGFGFLVSETGSGFTWAGNSQANRLTPWSNDPVSDPAGEAVYIRDDDDGAVWSPTPLPSPSSQPYRVRHSQGWTRFEHTAHAIEAELTLFVPTADPVKLRYLRLHNRGERPRRLTATIYVEWVLGTVRERVAPTVVTEHDPVTGALLAHNHYADPAARVGFLAASEPARGYTADRTEFLGRNGSRARPAGLVAGTLTGTVGAGLDPCGALEVSVELAPGQSRELIFLLGEAGDREQAGALIRAYGTAEAARQALEDVRAYWTGHLGSLQVATPNSALDLLVNHWLPYQALACRFWARSAFYQSGGAYGFRDQLQDVLAFLPSVPSLAREHILRAASRQFREGDVQHWWHPDSGQGVRTRCSDDLLWLPYATAAYVTATADTAILDEAVPFLEAPLLKPDEHDVLSVPAESSEAASLYDHCLRALDRGATAGSHGLPLIGDGDWNDGMNRVGQEGRGESVWLAWFLARTLLDFAPLAEARGDQARAERCRAEARRLGEAADAAAWDGAWYRRAYYDDGTPLGSKENAECTIDAIAQSWSVLAGVGDPDRARTAMRSAHEHLVRTDMGLVLLLTPPFDQTPRDPGYIKGYVPGVRENGGQYTHGVLWTAWATALQGDGDGAVALFDLLNPIHHAQSPAELERYRVEPYVVAADIYAARDHVGRGGWTWYTGSAGWMYRLAVEAILGFRLLGDRLRIEPAIPHDWPGFTLEYRRGKTRYEVDVVKAPGACRGVQRVELDGNLLPSPDIPLLDDGDHHRVLVVLGATDPTPTTMPKQSATQEDGAPQ